MRFFYLFTSSNWSGLSSIRVADFGPKECKCWV